MPALQRRSCQVLESVETVVQKKEIKQEMGKKMEKQQKKKTPML